MASKSYRSRRRYAYTRIVGHLHEQHNYLRLCELFDQTGFLDEQARFFQGFQNGARDLAEHMLPATIDAVDWPRFLRYTLVAMNLGEITAALAEEPILRGLVQYGRHAFAANLIDLLPDPLERAQARAVILSTAAGGSSGGPAATGPNPDHERLFEELDAAPPPEDAARARAWSTTLSTLAPLLAPDRLQPRWPGWIGALDALPDEVLRRELARQGWQALAERWIEWDLGEGSGIWEALGALRELGAGAVAPAEADATAPQPIRLEPLLAQLPRRLVASPVARPRRWLADPLPPPLAEDEELLWHLRVASWGRLAPGDQSTVAEAWEGLCRLPVAWRPELVATGRELWPHLGAGRLQALAGQIASPTVAAALLVTAVEQGAGFELEPAALHCLQVLSDARWQLHLSLRYLAAVPQGERRRRKIRRLARHLESLHYTAPAEDLARFLDLVSVDLGFDLSRQLENVVWAPSTSAETLRTLATVSGSRAVLTRLLEQAEEYAAVVAATQASGFAVRRDLLVCVTRRLYGEWGAVGSLSRAVRRLLPEEEERLRMGLIEELSQPWQPDPEARAFRRELALAVRQGLRSPRLRLLAGLRAAAGGEELEDDLAPAALYAAVAENGVAEDELHALAPLRDPSLHDPAVPARQEVSQVSDPDRRVEALLDLARHALACQRSIRPSTRLDFEAALAPLMQEAGAVTSDQRLAVLTPDLVAAASQGNPWRAVAEAQAAMERILDLKALDEEPRRAVLERLILTLAPALLGEDERAPAPRRCRALARVLRRLVRLASRDGETAPESGIWPRLLPVVVALPDRLPPLAQAYAWWPGRSRLCTETLFTVTRLIGLERMWAACQWLEKLVPPSLLRRLRSPWASGAEGFKAWLGPGQATAVTAFLARDDPALHRCAERALENPRPDPLEIETLAFFLSCRLPDRVPGLLDRLPPGPRRDRLCSRLLRGRWLQEEVAQEVVERIQDETVALQARIVLGMKASPEADWLADLGELLGRQQLDGETGELRLCDLRPAIRRSGREGGCKALAQATVAALGRGGRRQAEPALRLWLESFLLAPPRQVESFQQAAVAIADARQLSTRPTRRRPGEDRDSRPPGRRPAHDREHRPPAG